MFTSASRFHVSMVVLVSINLILSFVLVSMDELATTAVSTDRCASLPCYNGGICIDTILSFKCMCPLGKTGPLCNLDDACAANPCLPSAVCHNTYFNGSYECKCSPGWTGGNCDTDENECGEGSLSPCENGGSCVNLPGSFRCDCPVDFAGVRCEIQIDQCLSSPCQNDATCLDEIGFFRCICLPGFTGSLCELDIRCDAKPCLNNGSCVTLTNQCHCARGFIGTHCQFIDWCLESSGPCKNGATCVQTRNSFHCNCTSNWTGPLCDIMNSSCAVTAAHFDIHLTQLCQHGGTCHDVGTSHECHCAPGYGGSYCETHINECLSSPCQNGATCNDDFDRYTCDCAAGYSGLNCEIDIDECVEKSCENGGTCRDLVGGFSCSCPPGTLGIFCEVNVNECDGIVCHNGGTCMDLVGTFVCQCPNGFTGKQCEVDIDECSFSPCGRGLGVHLCQQTPPGQGSGYQCICKEGWVGSLCEKRVTAKCANDPCRNGGTCSPSSRPTCHCLQGYYGEFCEDSSCSSSPCFNGGTCIVDSSSGGYKCQCPRTWSGLRCQEYDESFTGGYGFSISLMSATSISIDQQAWQDCINNQCSGKAHNGRCDMECNTHACNFDGTDCSYGTSIYQNCLVMRYGIPCHDLYNNGVCNLACDSSECLNDGWDCAATTSTSCKEIYGGYCSSHYANGYCDPDCNVAECAWDGLDCMAQKTFAAGSLVLVILVSRQEFQLHSATFLLQLGELLHSAVVVEKDSSGQDMISSWPSTRRKRSLTDHGANWLLRRARASSSARTQINLQLDNGHCDSSQCLDTDTAAQFLAQALRRGFKPQLPIYSIQVDKPNSTDLQDSSKIVLIVPSVCTAVVFLALVVGVLVSGRKRARGTTWFPGFSQDPATNDVPRTHQQNASIELEEQVSTICNDGEPQPNVLIKLEENVSCSDGDCSPSDGTATRRYRSDNIDYSLAIDQRPWTQAHKDAFEGRVPRLSMSVLTSPDGDVVDQACASYVNVPGPSGFTPLMVAAMARPPAGAEGGAQYSSVDCISMSVLTPPEGDVVDQACASYVNVPGPSGFTPSTVAAMAQPPAGAEGGAQFSSVDCISMSVLPPPEGDVVDQACASYVNVPGPSGFTPLIVAAMARPPAGAEGGAQYNSVDCLSMSVLTPPEGDVVDQACASYVNVPSPSGFTPSTVAAMARPPAGAEGGAQYSSVDCISYLIAEGARLDACSDSYGETALHLAARFGRADAVRKLLNAGADWKATDNCGRTPFHSAIAADARDAFVVFLNHLSLSRSSSSELVNIPMFDGTTPLMTAVRLDAEDMVQDLLRANAKVNATDRHVVMQVYGGDQVGGLIKLRGVNLGKTALHWAAAVNNKDATTLLFSCGAHCDAQDDRKQTPLFLAAREGSFNVASILVRNHNANVELSDHMNCTPMAVALRHNHLEVVELLAEFTQLPAEHGTTSLCTSEQQAIARHSTTGITLPQAASKRSKKSTTATQRKPTTHFVDGVGNNVVLRATTSPTESATPPIPKRRLTSAAAARSTVRIVPTGQRCDDRRSIGIVPEQPPPPLSCDHQPVGIVPERSHPPPSYDHQSIGIIPERPPPPSYDEALLAASLRRQWNRDFEQLVMSTYYASGINGMD